MAKLPMMVEEADERPDPPVFVAQCCDEKTGLLVQIGEAWCLLRDNTTTSGHLATYACRIAVCRGCYRFLDNETPKAPWVFGLDEQIDGHLRQLSREMSK